METFQRESTVRGYHIYGEQWVAAVGEELECRRERRNPRDTYAVAVVRDDITVGHLPRKISRISASGNVATPFQLSHLQLQAAVTMCTLTVTALNIRR